MNGTECLNLLELLSSLIMYAWQAPLVMEFICYVQENIYTLLSRVLEAKRLYIQEGNHSPDKEDLARRVGITVEKLERLVFITRMPLSMQQPVWADQDTTFQVMPLLLSHLPSDIT